MFEHKETVSLNCSSQHIFNLVCAVDLYPEFLPWCVGSRIRSQTETQIIADLMIGYKSLRERFTSDVRIDPVHKIITTTYLEGPFQNMNSCWKITDGDTPDTCMIDFEVTFAFNNILLNSVLKGFFDHTAKKMVSAFTDRAYKTL